jgi:elongation factor Ts
MGMNLVKELRQRTGAGILDCKKALDANDNNIDAAIDFLRAKGMASAAKKASRAATEGLVQAYIHAGGKVGVLLEINCETDFVAKTEDFTTLIHDVCMHIAACAPEFVSEDQVPADVVEKERAVQLQRVIEEGKPEHIAERIVTGRMSKFYEESCLLKQKFVKDDSVTIEQMMTNAIARLGENIRIRRFSRFVLGEGLEKKTSDLAAEVAAAVAGN